MVVGDHASCDREQPRSRFGRNVGATAPGDHECLSRQVLGVGLASRPAKQVRHDCAVVLLEESFEARSVRVDRWQHPRETTGSGGWFPGALRTLPHGTPLGADRLLEISGGTETFSGEMEAIDVA